MRNCFYLLLLLSCLSFGQAKENIEELINIAYKEIVPADYNYFNLVDSSSVMKLNKYDLDFREHKKFFEENPDFNPEEFITKATIAQRLNWKDYIIEKAVIKAYKDFPRYAYHVRVSGLVPFNTPQRVIDSLKSNKRYDIVVPVKKSWTKKRIEKETEKKWQEYDAGFKPEDRNIYRFYTPLFSDDKLYAIVQLDGSGQGKYIVFKKVNGQWTKIYDFGMWVA